MQHDANVSKKSQCQTMKWSNINQKVRNTIIMYNKTSDEKLINGPISGPAQSVAKAPPCQRQTWNERHHPKPAAANANPGARMLQRPP
jgi:hypothetical protein